jgi:serine/threonine-protein kinase
MAEGLQPGEIIDGRYEIVRMIGRGAMANVYGARDTRADRPVAVKILNQSVVSDKEALARFQREARAQEMVQHRNVAALHGGGVTASRQPYLVVELLRGRSLRTILRREGRVGAVRASSYCWQALQGLAACHTQGILHRDLKPANMMLEPSEGPIERVVLIDFGFASLEGSSRLTRQGHVVGSLSYLAPERLRGEDGDERSDLYAVGVVFYELLCGFPPFVATDDFALISKHLDEAPVPPSEAEPEASVPAAIEAVLLRALAKRPVQRYRNAAEMAQAIEAATVGLG